MHIVICDNDDRFQRYFAQRLQNAFSERGCRADISCYHDPHVLLSKGDDADVYFCDVRLSGIDGISLASLLREKSEGEIVFVSNHQELIRSTLRVKPVAFIRKRALSADLPEALDAFWAEYLRKKKFLCLMDGKRPVNLEIRHITYFSSEKDYILAHFRNGDEEISLRQKMSVVEMEAAQYGFLRIHVRYLINLGNVERYDDKKRIVVMKDGTELPVSRGYLEGVKKVLGR